MLLTYTNCCFWGGVWCKKGFKSITRWFYKYCGSPEKKTHGHLSPSRFRLDLPDPKLEKRWPQYKIKLTKISGRDWVALAKKSSTIKIISIVPYPYKFDGNGIWYNMYIYIYTYEIYQVPFFKDDSKKYPQEKKTICFVGLMWVNCSDLTGAAF